MPRPIIEVERLSKRYTIGERQAYGSLREEIMQAASALFRARKGADASPTSLWALKDVSFAVEEGEVLGVIGANGAGKSTLLKVLTRITDPTAGRAVLRGRVASLLEVGTGFHHELTGRENVFLNGALLGMRAAEIRARFDEIVAFSGIERFLDTPVKRFSSGMYVRLAFAVAAHLQSEVLLMDEVLAVGDAAFQQRCLGKMSEVARGGRTVLFVSHNMGAIRSLCHKALLLKRGEVAYVGDVDQAIREHLADAADAAEGEAVFSEEQFADSPVKLRAVRTMGPDCRVRTQFTSDEAIAVELEFSLAERPAHLVIGFSLRTADGTLVMMSGHNDVREVLSYNPDRAYRYRLRAVIPGCLLNGGRYYVDAFAALHKVRWLFQELRAVAFDVAFAVPNTDLVYGAGRRGCVSPILEWRQVAD
jgi:lipopolysaccharide transport system ATP-binding protein